MRKLMIAAGAAALLASVSLASAADATGAIQSIDVAAGTVTLDSGQTFTLSADLVQAAANWKVGDKVTVTYDEADGKMTATAVAPAS
jgi:Cu/Ag efflux protein CusF